MSHRLRLLLILLCAIPTVGAAQGRTRPCRLVFDSLPNSSLWQIRDQFTGQISTWISGGVRARCQGTRIVISADSAEYSGGAALLTLVGNARYRDDDVTLDANVMRYYENDSRLEAQGNVRMRTATNTTLRALQVIHLREIPRVRQASTIALGRPRAVLRDSASTADSMVTTIDAERMYATGDTLLYAGGNVVITRPGLNAYADSTEATVRAERVRLLRGEPRIEGTGARAFTLRGRVLTIFGQQKQLRRVLAAGAASASSDSLTLAADTIDLRFVQSAIDHVYAWGRRPRAEAQGRSIVADSLDIALPGQQLRALVAIGRARAEAPADTAIRSDELDWIAGDTVRALFDSIPPGDTTSKPTLRVLESRGSARSFVQMAARDKSATLPALNYVTGRRIDINLRKGEVVFVHVTDQARGIYLEPMKADSTPPPRRRGGGD